MGRLVEVEIVYRRGVPPHSTYVFRHALIQDAAYQSLLKSTRQHYHQRIAQVLEAQFAETAEAAPELLAHHYTEAGVLAQAIAHWQRAGQQAVERSAHAEAVSTLTTALNLLTTLPESRERSQQELAIQITLSLALRVTKGGGAPEVERLFYTRARELCEQVGELSQLFRVLLGTLAGVLSARRVSDDADFWRVAPLSLAQRLHDPGPPVGGPSCPVGHPVLWRRTFCGLAPRGIGRGSMSRTDTMPMPRSTAGTIPACVAAQWLHRASGSSVP